VICTDVITITTPLLQDEAKKLGQCQSKADEYFTRTVQQYVVGLLTTDLLQINRQLPLEKEVSKSAGIWWQSYGQRCYGNLLWPPCVADADIIFLPCGNYPLSFFFSRLISAVADWMSAILPHMVWP